MEQALLASLVGKTVTGIFLVRYLSIGIERVVIETEEGKCVEFRSKEISLGRDEAYELSACEVVEAVPGTEPVSAGWKVGATAVVRREDWMETCEAPPPGIIGSNPRIHSWGPVGSAPASAAERAIIDFGIVIVSSDKLNAAMVYVSDYPGLVCFSNKMLEIEGIVNDYKDTSS